MTDETGAPASVPLTRAHEAQRIWGADAMYCVGCVAWHHRNFHGESSYRLSFRLRLRLALAAFLRELRHGR